MAWENIFPVAFQPVPSHILEQVDIRTLDPEDKDLSGQAVLLKMPDLTFHEFTIITDDQ